LILIVSNEICLNPCLVGFILPKEKPAHPVLVGFTHDPRKSERFSIRAGAARRTIDSATHADRR
jgi:hypothetical protein